MAKLGPAQRRKLGLLPPPLAGEGWGEGDLARTFVHAPSLSLPRRKSGLPDLRKIAQNPGKPGFCRERGRCGADPHKSGDCSRVERAQQ
jgi:hypothetical protein